MAEGIVINENGSISNRIVASNIKNGFPFPDNVQILATECTTKQHADLKATGRDEMVNTVTIGEYGMAGHSFHVQRCAKSLRPRIYEAILKAEEKSIAKGHTLKMQLTTIFPTGTSATVGPIAANVAKSMGLDTLVFAVLPDVVSQSFQLINAINAIALSSFHPLVLIEENHADMVLEETRARADLAAGGTASKFYAISQDTMEFGCKLARLISGSTEKTGDSNESDELSFLDAQEEGFRNQSKEIASAISGKSELYIMHHSRSRNNDFEQMGILKPSIQARCPGDPVVFIEYQGTLSEDDVANAVLTCMDNQQIRPERLCFLPSDHNSVTAIIPTKIPQRLKDLISYVSKDKPLSVTMKKWAMKTILTSIFPIQRGSEDHILKNRLGKIFYDNKSEVEALAKTLGLTQDLDELKERNLLFHLAEEYGVYLKPLEVS